MTRKIEAEETMLRLRIEDWTKMKDQARTKFWNELKKVQSETGADKKATSLSNEDLAKWLRGALG